MAEPRTGDVIDGRYKVLSRLGAGGMADVYLAEDLQLGRKIALKLLHRRFAEDPDFVERFRREAQAAAGLQHPNVVSVYDRGSYDETYYIAMEYLPGRSLKQLIRQDAPLDPLQAIDLATQILRAARFAHRRGVIHRDLKPHNVIVDDGGHAKVTDFGIARAGASDMTETGSIMGTAQYLSPEQAQGLPVGAQSDLYSVGVVLYEMLTGRLPFDADSAVTIALKHVSEAPPPPSQLNPRIPAELEQVVLWTLNKNPSDRPADADQLITVLEQVKDAITARERGQRTASMAALGVIPPAAIHPLAPVPGAGPPTDMQAATSAYEAAERGGWNGPPTSENYGEYDDDRRGSPWPWVIAVLVALLLIGGGVLAYVLTRPTKETVPNVVRLSINNARAKVQSAGLSVNVQYQSDSFPNGTVINQYPYAGQRLNENSVVTLTVSSGPGNITVPPLVGLSSAVAQRQLRAAGLKPAQVVKQNSAAVAAGQVISTSPAAGVSVPPGTPITLIVSNGKPPATKVLVPNVQGDTQANARSNLTQAGFLVTSSQQISSTVMAGNVISQSPAGGARAASGSTVNIVVAAAPTTTNVPPVVGDTLAGARSTLTGAGFKVAVQKQTTSNVSENGIVLSQSPTGGQATKGATVTVVVGVYKKPTGPTGPTGTTGTSGATGTSGK
ncbi:MAG: Stk1 family PASTA domain-containing Ser/Thr kinase [Solirubrobacteraceae bacterium]